MSNEETLDPAELFEYDEFDSYDEQTYHTHATANSESNGVPLSVELSDFFCKQNSTLDLNASFERAPEIFLRIEANNSNATTSNNNILTNVSENWKSFESNDSCENVILSSNSAECIELQYENEFVEDNEIDYDSTNVAYHRRNSIENDYEQLLFEGIISLQLVGTYIFYPFLFCILCFRPSRAFHKIYV